MPDNDEVMRGIGGLFRALGLGLGDSMEIRVRGVSAPKVAETLSGAVVPAPGKLEYEPPKCPCCGMGVCCSSCPESGDVPASFPMVNWPEECPQDILVGQYGLAMRFKTYVKQVAWDFVEAVFIPEGQDPLASRLIIRINDGTEDTTGVCYPENGAGASEVQTSADTILRAWYQWARQQVS